MGILNWLSGGNTLYYPGCLTKGILKQEFENYKVIFNKLGIDFILLPDEACCGLPVLNAGYKKDARNLAKKNLILFKEKNIKKIITNCPSCYHTFKHLYPELLTGKENWDIEVEHATQTILKKLKSKGIKSKISEQEREIIVYHDPCHLGRYSDIYEEPRQVIELLGGKIIELPYNRENAICCGAGAGIKANFPEIAKQIAEKKAGFIPAQAEKIISPCGLCFSNLKSATDKSEEFSSFVLRKLEALK